MLPPPIHGLLTYGSIQVSAATAFQGFLSTSAPSNPGTFSTLKCSFFIPVHFHPLLRYIKRHTVIEPKQQSNALLTWWNSISQEVKHCVISFISFLFLVQKTAECVVGTPHWGGQMLQNLYDVYWHCRFSLEPAIPPHLTLMEFGEFCFNNFNLILHSLQFVIKTFDIFNLQLRNKDSREKI